MGMKAEPVVVVSDTDLIDNGGQYKLINNSVAILVEGNDSLVTIGGSPSTVYPVSQSQVDSGQFSVVGGEPVRVAQVSGRGRDSSKWAVPIYDPTGTWPSSGACDLDPEYCSVESSYSSIPSTTWRTAASQLFIDIRSALSIDSLSAAFDFMYILAHEKSADALINIANPGTHDATNVSSMAFEASRGYTGNGTSSYLNSNYNPATEGVNYLLNSASMGFYCRTELDGGPAMIDMGALGGVNRDTRIISRAINFVFSNINTSMNTLVGVNASSLSLFVVNRSSSTQQTIYKSGSSVASTNSASVGVPANNIYIGAFNNSGTAAFFTTRQYATAFAGRSMDATEQADFYGAVETFMDAIGAGVVAAPAEEPSVVFEPLTEADALGGILLAQQGVNPTDDFGAYSGR